MDMLENKNTEDMQDFEDPTFAADKTAPEDVAPKGAAAPNSLKKNRLIIAIITLVAALAFIIAGSVLLADGGSTYYDDTIYTGSNYVYVSGSSSDPYVYKFSPSYSGYYTFYTTGSYDTVCKLADETGVVARNDDGGSGNNFSLEYYLYSGEDYYLSVWANTSGNVYLYVTRNG